MEDNASKVTTPLPHREGRGVGLPPILDVGGVLISSDLLTERFCCDYEKCRGVCCIEGDAGAPVTMDEIAGIEEALDTVWSDLSASAQSVIDRQGVAYTDQEGDLVTSIVRGKDCVFTYPIRAKQFADGTVALNYHRWKICEDAVKKGQALDLPVYQFLKEPLTRRFGEAWYQELCNVADELRSQGYL